MKTLAAIVLALSLAGSAQAATRKAPAITSKTAIVKAASEKATVYLIRKTSGQWQAVDADGQPVSLKDAGIVDGAIAVQVELLHADTAGKAVHVLAQHGASNWTYSAEN